MGESRRQSASSKNYKASSSSRNDKENIDNISKDDYYLKAVEFEKWLRQRGFYFDELSKRETKGLFDKFVRRWNSGRLDKKFYSSEKIREGKSNRWTRYSWKINGVESNKRNSNIRFQNIPPPRNCDRHNRNESEAVGGSSEVEGKENRYAIDRGDDRRTTMRRRKHFMEEIVEEIAPKAVGREAMLEKKRAKNRYYTCEVETLPEASEDLIMTGGAASNTDDYHALLQREKKRRKQIAEAKNAELQSKLDAYKDREKKNMDMLMNLATSRYGTRPKDS